MNYESEYKKEFYNIWRGKMYRSVELLGKKFFKITYHNNTIAYKKGTVFHREGGPAIIHENGAEEWIYMGKMHNLHGPARTLIESTKIFEWWVDGYPVTSDFPKWAKDNEIVYPFSTEQETFFKLRWVNYGS